MKIRYIYIIFILSVKLVSAQEDNLNITLSGHVYNSADKKPLDFTTIAIPELKIKTRTNANGYYSLKIPKAGFYTIFVSSPGLKLLKTEIQIETDTSKDFFLGLAKLKAETLEIKAEREIQKISRYTMTSQEIKDVPGSFGDSISALSALPGVIRTSGFFGPLVIRGAPASYNRYFIDDIPVYEPQHFMGLHSIISSDLMSEVDLYASANPSEFSQAAGAVIDINTIDNVKDLSGNSEVSLISSNLLIKAPFGAHEEIISDSKNQKNIGYWILSGRYSYYEIFLPPIIEYLTGQDIKQFPKYWDYQAKGKYYLTPKHSVTAFLFGFQDKMAFAFDMSEEEKKEASENGMDPLFGGFSMQNDVGSNAQSLRFNYRESAKFENTLVFYSVLNQSLIKVDIEGEGINEAFQGISINSNPFIFGIKNKLKYEYLKDLFLLDSSQLSFISEINYYKFNAYGKSLIEKAYQPGPTDWTQDLWEEVYIDQKGYNLVYSASVENKFLAGGLKFIPAVRADFLKRTKKTTIDPRGAISYEFDSQTTIAAAAGYYSSFLQINPYYFNQMPDISEMDIIPERSIHRSFSIEQKFNLYSLQVEGYYNNFYDLMEDDPHFNDADELVLTRSAGKRKNYGFEILFKKDKEENTSDFYGWLSYTYAQAKHKSGLESDIYGDQYLPFTYEQEHSFKMVAGYSHKNHTIEGKFQLYSSFPYTPIVGSLEIPADSDRHTPIYGDKFSKRMPISHRLDLRYSKKTSYEWGFIKWYVEAINVYSFSPLHRDWDYNEPYQQGVNPEFKKSEGLSFIPTFGVEARF
ncbi:MAG: TonB-dependent receptor [Spirochaetia bacterium]|nr:TonB-dependent receptor [Spirochaetia bacterium]